MKKSNFFSLEFIYHFIHSGFFCVSLKQLVFIFVVLSHVRWIFMAEAKVYLIKLYSSMNSLFGDIDIYSNFLGDLTNQQGDHLRHYFDTADFNTEFSSNDENDKTLKILNMNIR